MSSSIEVQCRSWLRHRAGDPSEAEREALREAIAQAPNAWWNAILAAAAELTDEWSAEGLGAGPLRELISTDPDSREAALHEAMESPRFARVLASSIGSHEMYDTLGADKVAEAYVRFADPGVAGWWDGWSSGAFDYVLWQRPAGEAWSLLLRIVDRVSAGGAAIQDIGNMLVTDFVGMWGDEFIDRIERTAPEDPLFAEALRSGFIHYNVGPETRQRLEALGLTPLED